MTFCRTLIFACLPLAAGVAAAQAADLGGAPPERHYADDDTRPSLQWTGLYAGANLGASFGRDAFRENSAAAFDGTDFERFRSRSSGFTGGGQLGYNYQTGHVVMGLEADLNYANGSRSVASSSGAVTASSSGNLAGSLRSRLGYAIGPWLLYGTGGLADNTGNTLSATSLDGRFGWVAGAGVEYMLDRNWSIRTEFLHTDFGRTTFSGVALDGNTYSWRDHTADNAIRAGVNFRF
jgi:outer membrane immunogenic protein